MKLLVITLLCIPFALTGQNLSQQVLANQGGFSISPEMSLSWTIGQSFVETIYLENMILTQGFQQPTLAVVEVNKEALTRFEATLFPNPTSSLLHLEIHNHTGEYKVQIVDAKGSQVNNFLTSDLLTTIDLTNYPAGQYFVRIASDNMDQAKLSVFEVIKH